MTQHLRKEKGLTLERSSVKAGIFFADGFVEGRGVVKHGVHILGEKSVFISVYIVGIFVKEINEIVGDQFELQCAYGLGVDSALLFEIRSVEVYSPKSAEASVKNAESHKKGCEYSIDPF